MSYFFAEIKDKQVIALHESTGLDLVFRQSDGILVELTEKEYNLLKACRGDIVQGILSLRKVQDKIFNKIVEN